MLNERMPHKLTLNITPDVKINRYVKTEDTER